MLFVFRLLFLLFRAQTNSLATRASISAEALGVAANLAAVFQSFIEDQRSVRPSDVLVLYFSASSILYIPRLRTLWLMQDVYIPRALWTVIFSLSILAVCLESAQKTELLRSLYKTTSAEATAGFWNRSLFIWVNSLFKLGHSKNLSLQDIPQVDKHLKSESTAGDLAIAWSISRGRHRLLKAALRANSWLIFSAIIPRLYLSGFTFCQPFLIESVVSTLDDSSGVGGNFYGKALIGGFLLVYVGIAVSYWSDFTWNVVGLPSDPRYPEQSIGVRHGG